MFQKSLCNTVPTNLLTYEVAFTDGLGSVTFGISVVLALVIMYDAAGLRQAIGQQSVVLNRIMRELKLRRPVAEVGRDLRELVGHTPFQVIVGGLLGIFVALSYIFITGI